MQLLLTPSNNYHLLTGHWLSLISSLELGGAFPHCLPLKIDSLLMLIAHEFI